MADEDGDEPDEILEEYEIDIDGWEELPEDAREASRLLLSLRGLLPEVVERALVSSMDSLSEGEERIRKVVGERKLGGGAVAYLLEHADNFKDELISVVAGEVREALEEADLGGELARILTRLSLEATIQVRFRENTDDGGNGSVEPDASGRMRIREEADEE